ncbi:MarR family transcriptional regulator [Gottschalkia acidurici 9a]|uniref:MarR family transcriptional regulator n=1 Tax=Gottschalkia acidurici (strain ATCC 7906 / DSM 604 / BCRC 14475 / CIP 104303 / KCTC 5404 / NCIMB 10678 / 9a) TaxID=1128398 RepID=K0B2R1_GOTA9|nr:MarR family transcriptional regulator [Gottschalkia acidurici]AFS79402.1 MarR family transcriptional regulator [Gottschalkia acidurici 9a]
MSEEKVREIAKLFFEFSPLYQKKIISFFSKCGDKTYKCNSSQVKAIMIIGGKESIIPTKLGQCLGLQKGSLTTLLDSLENMNLIKRSSHPEDRRKTLISLTEEGNNLRNLKLEEFQNNISKLFSKFPEEKLDEFLPSFKNVLDTVKEL